MRLRDKRHGMRSSMNLNLALVLALGAIVVGVVSAIWFAGDEPRTARFLIVLSSLPLLVLFLWPVVAGGVVHRWRFRRRLGLPDDVFFEGYRPLGYPRELVCGLRKDVASAFGLPYDKLRPEHSFTKELARSGIDVSGILTDAFADSVEASVDRVGGRPELNKVATVDQYIRAFCDYVNFLKTGITEAGVCPHCGYDLRGRTISICSECGEPMPMLWRLREQR